MNLHLILELQYTTNMVTEWEKFSINTKHCKRDYFIWI